jgi:GNAT superfamily N-acetyltransferase
VAAPRDAPAHILGHYTLSRASIEFRRAPAVENRGLNRYEIPVYRLGRLAVDRSMQGRELGGRLLLRASERCITVAQEVGGVALLIDAKSDDAAKWYESYGALRLLDAPPSLVLPFSVRRGFETEELKRVLHAIFATNSR